MSDTGPSEQQTELDALIGDIRGEAARRRAAPDFPLDDEARLSAAMDGEGPIGSGADLAALAAGLRQIAGQGGVTGQVAGLSASAVSALSARLSHIERRVPALSRVVRPTGGSSPDLTGWLERWEMPTGGSPILVAGKDAVRWLDRLGPEAYGIVPEGPALTEAGAVRQGPLIDHLSTVGDEALALVIVAGDVDAGAGPDLHRWAAELARVTANVRICAEAPWAWQQRLGEASADQAASRPLSPETWLELLAGAGFAVTGRYEPDGRQYGIEANRRP